MAVLNLGIIAVQVVAGIAAHSVGLIADAGHNVGDVAAIAVSWGALRLARRSSSARRTYALHRAGVLAAQANAVSMLVVCAVPGRRSGRAAGNPFSVRGPLVVIVALVALVGNLASARLLSDHGGDVNLRSALFHMAADAGASAAHPVRVPLHRSRHGAGGGGRG